MFFSVEARCCLLVTFAGYDVGGVEVSYLTAIGVFVGREAWGFGGLGAALRDHVPVMKRTLTID